MKLQRAKERRELALVKLQQLERMKELEMKQMKIMAEKERFELQNEYEQALVSENIWSESRDRDCKQCCCEPAQILIKK